MNVRAKIGGMIALLAVPLISQPLSAQALSPEMQQALTAYRTHWIEITASQEGQIGDSYVARTFMRPDVSSRNGNILSIAVLLFEPPRMISNMFSMFSNPDDKPAYLMGELAMREYDCAGRQVRTIEVSDLYADKPQPRNTGPQNWIAEADMAPSVATMFGKLCP